MAQIALGDIEKHFWLTRSVARCLGLSLTDAMTDGRLSAEGYAELVTRCRASNCDAQCALWLADQQSIKDAAPEFCANADALNALAQRSKPRV